MPITVELPGFESLAQLVAGATGTVSGNTLSGPYRLEILGYPSGEKTLGSPADVMIVTSLGGDRYRLERADRPIVFDFAGFPAGVVGGPRLDAKQVVLARPDRNRPCVFGMKSVSLSLIPRTIPNGTDGNLIFPTLKGKDEVILYPPYHPELGQISPIVSSSDGFLLKAGPRALQSDIMRLGPAVVTVGPDVDLTFMIADGRGRPRGKVEFSSKPGDADLYLSAEQAGLTFTGFDDRNRPIPAPSGIAGAAAFSRLTIEGDLATLDTFDGAVAQAQCRTLAQQMQSTKVQGFGAQFKFLMRLPQEAGGQLPAAAAQLVYRDDRVQAGNAYSDYRQRFHGLSIGGFTSSRSDTEWFDCSQATATTDASGRFQLRAGSGTPLPIISGETAGSGPALLLPKRNARGDREVETPVGSMRLVIDGESGGGFRIDTTQVGSEFELVNPMLRGTINGLTGDPKAGQIVAMNAANERFSPWTLQRQGRMAFALTDEGMAPIEKDGAWAKSFDYAEQEFRLLEHPGSGFAVRRRAAARTESASTRKSRPSAGKARETRTELTEFKTAAGDQVLAISELYAGLTYLPCGKYIPDAGNDAEGRALKYLDVQNIELQLKLIEGGNLLSYAKGWAPNDVRLVLGAATGGVSALRKFIDDNVPKPQGNEPVAQCFYQRLVGPVSVLLRERKSDGTYVYCDQMAAAWSPPVKTVIAIDMSEVNALTVAEAFPDSGATSWADITKEHPDLWPAASAPAKKDPSVPAWKGVFFRGMRLNVVPSDEVRAKIEKDFPALKTLLDEINNGLRLEYGWYDESGPTWNGSFKPASGIEILKGIDKHVSLKLLGAFTKGASGNPTGGAASVLVAFPVLAKDASKVPTLDGKIAFDLVGDSPFARVSLVGTHGELETDKVPGFEKVSLVGFSTDFRLAQADFVFVPGTLLRSLFRAFDKPASEPFKAAFSIDLNAKSLDSLSFVIPHEIKTSLLGKWPVTIQSIRLKLPSNGAPTTLIFTCKVTLGMPGIESVGAVVELVAGSPEPKITLDAIRGNLSFGDLAIKADIAWRAPQGSTGTDRDFWGSLTLEGGVFKSGTQISLRIGAVADRPFWVAGMKTDELKIGGVTIEEPVLLLAHGADIDGGLKPIIANPEKSLKPIRGGRGKESGPRDEVKDEAWLATWKPSSDMGSVFAASGYLRFDKTLASSTKDKDKDDQSGKYLTNLIMTDSGQVRADAWIRLLGADQGLAHLVLGIDFEGGSIAAGVQLPKISIPSPAQPKWEIHPGFMYVKFSYKGSTSFILSVGWPDRVDGPGLERDWSKSTKVFISEMWPINTFWGGWRLEYVAGQKVSYGIAVRAGWTQTYRALPQGSIANAEAELGITLGGVFIFEVGTIDRTVLPSILPRTEPALLPPAGGISKAKAAQMAEPAGVMAVAEEALGVLDAALAASGSLDLSMTAELYGDIWGRGSCAFLGVTLASIKVAAYARFETQGSLRDGIKTCRSITGYGVEIVILCVGHSADVEVEIWVIRK